MRKQVGTTSGYDYIIDAVYQSVSTDEGKIWSDPIVTTDAKIFEVGKSWLEQSFIARPIKINGKAIKAEFPSVTPAKKIDSDGLHRIQSNAF